jgi:teichuronic acid biosynthesis glycosyltransferase TuaG
MHLVSIILPYFKKKEFIKSTLLSIFNQSYKNFEVLIIYDDLDLSDFYYINDIIRKDKRFKIYKNKKNFGVSYSRNKGIKFSKGEYICFLDADDLWAKNKLEKQIIFMRDNNAAISCTSYKIINSFNKLIGVMKVKREVNYNDLIKSCDIGLSTVMLSKKIKKSMISFPNIKTKEDYILWLKLSKKYKIYGFKQCLVSWRKTNSSLSSSIIRKLIDGYKVYNKFEKKNVFISFLLLINLSVNYLLKRFIQKIEKIK